MQIFKELEEFVKATLESEIFTIGVRTLDFYSNQLNVEDIEDITIQYPFVYISVGTMDLKNINQRDACEISIYLISGDRNLRGFNKTTSGDQSSPGLYAIMQKNFELLHGKKGVVNTTPFFLKKVIPLAYSEKYNICVYEQEFITKYSNIRSF